MNSNSQNDNWYVEPAIEREELPHTNIIADCEVRILQARKALKKAKRCLASWQTRVADLEVRLSTQSAFGLDRGELKVALKEAQYACEVLKKHQIMSKELMLQHAIEDYKMALEWCRTPAKGGEEDEDEEEAPFRSKRMPK